MHIQKFVWFAFLAIPGAIYSQQVSGDSNLNWNAQTQTLTASAYSELDAEAGVYYVAYVNSVITDQNGNVIASKTALAPDGDTPAQVTSRRKDRPATFIRSPVVTQASKTTTPVETAHC